MFNDISFIVTLSIDPIVEIIGLSETTIKGKGVVSNLMIQIENIYTLSATGIGLTISSIIIEIKNYYIDIKYSPEPVRAK